MGASQTAGDLIRAAVSDGESKRGLASRLAGDGADHKTIERWRFVVNRAVEKHAEPREAQADRVAEVFGTEVRGPAATEARRRDGDQGGQLAEILQRLERLEERLVSHDSGGEKAAEEILKGLERVLERLPGTSGTQKAQGT